MHLMGDCGALRTSTYAAVGLVMCGSYRTAQTPNHPTIAYFSRLPYLFRPRQE